jgi:hypothetical protein
MREGSFPKWSAQSCEAVESGFPLWPDPCLEPKSTVALLVARLTIQPVGTPTLRHTGRALLGVAQALHNGWLMHMLRHSREDSVPPPPKIVAPPIVRRATRADVPAIVQLQTISLPHFDLADPGPAFLRSFYSLVSYDHQGLLFVSECDHELAGFVVGLSDPQASL